MAKHAHPTPEPEPSGGITSAERLLMHAYDQPTLDATHATVDRLLDNLEVTVDDIVALIDDGIEFGRAPQARTRIADLDGTDDAADWLTVGHVLDAQEVEWLRSLEVPRGAE